MKKIAQTAWLLLTLLVGLVPSLLFFAWVERNASLPWLPIGLGWPWISFPEAPVWQHVFWDGTLILIFGFLHTLFAQAATHRVLERWIPKQALRSFYMLVTGGSLVLVMGLWQSTGVIVWALPLSFGVLNAISLIIYWSCLAAAAVIVARMDALHFIGIRQLSQRSDKLERSAGTPELKQNGFYGRVRHPIYTLTLLAFALTPFMTLDRLVVLGATALYLAFAIPIEEKKLVALFGPSYESYRKRVPAVIPHFGPRLGRS